MIASTAAISSASSLFTQDLATRMARWNPMAGKLTQGQAEAIGIAQVTEDRSADHAVIAG